MYSAYYARSFDLSYERTGEKGAYLEYGQGHLDSTVQERQGLGC